jgi:branched-chain amino acid transport system permease protein
MTRYEDDVRLFPDFWHKVGLAAGALFALVFVAIADSHWMSVGNLALTSIVGAVGMMILTGFTGQISLGHAAFLAVGAYTAAVLGSTLGLPFWLILPIAGLTAASIGMAVGPFALRLEGLYLAIVTIGLLFLVNHILLSFPALTRGVSGIAVPMYLGFGAGSSTNPLTSITEPLDLGPVTLAFEQKLFFIYLALGVFSLWVARNIRRSNTGRALMAVRDHDLAAAVLGVRCSAAKIMAFGVSSFFGGVAGAMFGFQQQFITVDPPFNLQMSVQYIAIIVLGGMGTTFGAAAGALFFTVVAPLAEMVGRHIPWVNNLSSAQQSALLFSLLVVVFLLLEPLGLFGIWLRVKRYFAAWPFKY